MRELFLIALAAAAVLAAVFLLLPRGEGVGSSYDWVLTATEARIIGGYGAHFQSWPRTPQPITPKTARGCASLRAQNPGTPGSWDWARRA